MEKVFDFIAELFLTNGIIIAAAAFVIAEIIKKIGVPGKFIPLIGGVVGILLGILIPNIFPGKDIVTAGVLGLCLGWAATGGFETIKQLKEKK